MQLINSMLFYKKNICSLLIVLQQNCYISLQKKNNINIEFFNNNNKHNIESTEKLSRLQISSQWHINLEPHRT